MCWRVYWDQETDSWLRRQFRVNWQSFFPGVWIWQIMKEGHWWFAQWLLSLKRAHDWHRPRWHKGFKDSRPGKAFISDQNCYFRISIVQRVWKRYYSSFISKESRQEQSVVSNNVWLMNMMIGEQETSRKRVMFISRQIAFISTSGVMMPSNAFWLLLVWQVEVIRSSLLLKMAIENQSRVGQKCCSVLKTEALDRPSWLWVMAH